MGFHPITTITQKRKLYRTDNDYYLLLHEIHNNKYRSVKRR